MVQVRPKPGEASQPRLLRVDHSAQLLSASTPRFQRMLDHWQGLGLIQPYPQGAVGTLDAATGGFAPRGAHLPPVYHPTGVRWPPLHVSSPGHAPPPCHAACCSDIAARVHDVRVVQGMRALAEHLAEGLAVQRPVWVGRVQRRDPAPGAPVVWDVFGERSKHLGAFDFLVSGTGGPAGACRGCAWHEREGRGVQRGCATCNLVLSLRTSLLIPAAHPSPRR